MVLTTKPLDAYLDMPRYRGQRVDSFTFEWRSGLTDQFLGYLTPQKDTVPKIDHNTSQSIKRRLTLNLGVDDTAAIDPVTDRILPAMRVGGTTYPLGRFMFTDETDLASTAGERGTFVLLDEGNIIDQQLENSFTSLLNVSFAVRDLLDGLPIPGVTIESTPYTAIGSFSAGQSRVQALDTLTLQGDYFPYWMGNDTLLHLIRTVDPAAVVPAFDLDAGGAVIRDSIALTSDVLVAPNRFIVISNFGSNAFTQPVVGTYDVPASAPHSIVKRGFVVPRVETLQSDTFEQAEAMARNLGLRQTVFERIEVSTSLDPRHDSYDVVHYRGANWLELAWSMELVPGGSMRHTMRKAYA